MEDNKINKINKINNNDTKENSIIDITPINNQLTVPVLVKLQWSKNYETIFADWCDKAMSYRYLHSECNRYYNQYNNIVTIPVIIISTMTGVANFAQSRVPEDYVPYYTIVVGGLNILAGLITTITHFLKIAELNESHRVATIAWGKFCRNIKIELAKHPNEREPLEIYLKKAKEQYDLLLETSPFIRHKEIILFNNKFKKKIFFKPEICDSLESVTSTIYTADYIDNNDKDDKDETLKIIENIKQKKTDILENLKIEDFIKKYKEQNNRDPSVEEIYTNLEDNILKKYIDKFVCKYKSNSMNIHPVGSI